MMAIYHDGNLVARGAYRVKVNTPRKMQKAECFACHAPPFYNCEERSTIQY